MKLRLNYIAAFGLTVLIALSIFLSHSLSGEHLASYLQLKLRLDERHYYPTPACSDFRASSRFHSTCPNDTLPFSRPYRYAERVDLRIIVLTMNRGQYLKDLLDSIKTLEMDGDKLAVEIWIDKDLKNQLDANTLKISEEFSRSNKYTKVHVQSTHAGLYGQWLLTYSSYHLKEGEKEIVLFIEDDQNISKFGYRWLKAVHEHYFNHSDFLGCSLRILSPIHHSKVPVPSNHTVFMHRIFSTHAFSPRLDIWRDFQTWFAIHFDRKAFKPYVPGILPTAWYKHFEKINKTHTMWSMWFLYYTYIEQLFAVYNNPAVFSKLKDMKVVRCLNEDRQAAGLHFKTNPKLKGKNKTHFCKLLDYWKDDFVLFPERIIKVNWDGTAYKE